MMYKRKTLLAAGLIIGLIIGLTAALVFAQGNADRTVEKPASDAQHRVALLKKIDVSGFGVWSGLRLGDLNGDNRLDIVLAQNKDQAITCITAVDMNGKQLWQAGKPDTKNYQTSYDLPVQIYDIDLDGDNEVICIMDGRLKILNGTNGAVEREVRLPSSDAADCIVIANFSGSARPRDVLIKNRYDKVWALDQDLRVMWSYSGNTGHYPWPHDFDGDGKDELMCGFALLNHDGTKQWEAELPGHSDAIAIGNVDGDGASRAEIALACCGGKTFALLNDKGGIIWRHPCGHAQHIIIGDFRPDLPGLEVCGLDRGHNHSAAGVDAMVLYSAEGKQLWREKRTDKGKNRWLSAITAVSNWDERPGDIILAYRRGGSISPTLYDGHGRAIAVFPFPNPESQHFALHADICGDEREEIVIWNEKEIHIYQNAAAYKGTKHTPRRNQARRLYNYTHYIGMP